MVSTQQIIPVNDVKNNLFFLKNGSSGLIITTSAVNFGLLFETEQMSIIDSFAGLLNSLSFPIQIIIRSKRLDISTYLTTLDRVIAQQTNPLLSKLAVSYRKFVESLIKEKNVLDKQFYICLTASPLELGFLPKNETDRIKKINAVLSPRRDHLIRQLAKLGLKASQLQTEELVKLFYDIYNGGQIALPQTQTVMPTVTHPITLTPPPTPSIHPSPLPINLKRTISIPRPPSLPYQQPPQSQPNTPNFSPIPLTPYRSGTGQANTPFIVEELPDDT